MATWSETCLVFGHRNRDQCHSLRVVMSCVFFFFLEASIQGALRGVTLQGPTDVLFPPVVS